MNTQKTTTEAAQYNAVCDAAVEALVANLPTAGAVTAARMTKSPVLAKDDAASPILIGFVGQVSADLALKLTPGVLQQSGGLDLNRISIEDILRPSLEAATGVLGTGVISSANAETTEALVKDSTTVSYQLSADGAEVGFFSIRLRTKNAAEAAVNAAFPGAMLSAGSESGQLDPRLSRLRNVQMGLTVEIGRARVSVRDVLGLEPGAVIELDRNAGAPADVRLNGRLIAQGEVVVMDQEYGVRITKILDSSDNAQ